MPRKSRKNNFQNKPQLIYENLEDRQLLAVDTAINFTGSTFQTETTDYPSFAVNDVGPNNIVEALNGRISVHDRTTGQKTNTWTLENFFLQAGGFVPDDVQDPGVLFDHFSQRWFVSASGDTTGNWIHLAFSDTADASGTWQTVQFVGDSTGRAMMDQVDLGVDADAIYFASNDLGGPTPLTVSLFSIPKADLLSGVPTLTNMSRFERLDPLVYGQTLKIASNFEASDGRVRVMGTIRGPSNETLFMQTDIVGADAPSATLDGPYLIGDDILLEFFFPFIAEAPDVRQPWREGQNPEDETGYEHSITHANWQLNGSIVEADGGVWVAYPRSYSTIPAPIPVSGIQWLEIDPILHQVRLTDGDYGGYNMGVIGDNLDEDNDQQYDLDFFNPAFSVNEHGVAVLAYNASGFVDDFPQLSRNLYASSYVSVGITTNGIDARRTQFEVHPTTNLRGLELHPGLANYEIDPFRSPWTPTASVKFDSVNPNNFVLARQVANTEDRYHIQNILFKPVDINDGNPQQRIDAPMLWGDDGNNVFTIRRNPTRPDLMQIEIDGIVRDDLPYEVLDRVRLVGGDGADRFILDYTYGDPIADAQLIIDGGDGPDVLQSNNPGPNSWEVIPTDHDLWDIFRPNVDFGEGTLNVNTDFLDIEELWGGDGDDYFLVTEIFPPPTLPNDNGQCGPGGIWCPRQPGFIAGSILGRGGDDTFEFRHRGSIGDSVNGGTGYNTLKFTQRAFDTDIELTGYGGSIGYNGRTLGPIGQGPIGGDQIQDQFRDISQIVGADPFYIDANGNLIPIYDTVVGLDEQALLSINDPISQYETNGVTLDLDQIDELSLSDSFDDTINAYSNSLDAFTVNSLGGNDVFNFSSDGPALQGITDDLNGLIVANGGTGENLLNVSHIGGSGLVDTLIVAARITGMGEIVYTTEDTGTFDLNVWGSNEADDFRIHSFLPDNTLNVFSLNGNDHYDLQDLSKAVVKLYGGEGDDVYVVQRISGVSFRNLEIIDSIDAEQDRVTLAGSVLSEVFIINTTTFDDIEIIYTGIEYFGIEGRGGDDTFHIQSSTVNLYVDGGAGNDIFNVSSDAGLNNGDLLEIMGSLIIEGGTGSNRLNISYEMDPGREVKITSDRMFGLVGGPISYNAIGGDFYGDGLSEGIQIEGSRIGGDTINITGLKATNRLRVQTFGGVDRFTVRSNVEGDVVVDGGDDFDFYSTFFNGLNDREVVIRDRSDEKNRVIAYGTNESDSIRLDSNEISRGNEVIYLNTDINFLQLVGLDGDDSFAVNDSIAQTTHVLGSDGADLFTVENTDSMTGLRLVGNDGDDRFVLDGTASTTFTTMIGNADNDTFIVNRLALGDVRADGNDGSDVYDVTFANNGSDRLVITRDSGSDAGIDHSIGRGTNNADDMEIRSTRLLFGNETVAFGPDTEIATIDGLGGNDNLTMYASFAGESQLMGGEGDDNLFVTSTAHADVVTTFGGFGNDTTLVTGVRADTVVNAHGDRGDDLFNFGSSMADDNGNLGRIRGDMNVFGGIGADEVYINDAAANAPYSFNSTGTMIKSIPGPKNIPRPAFGTIEFDQLTEKVRLDGSEKGNYFSVSSSPYTTFYFDGNNPTGDEGDFIHLVARQGDGHNLTISDFDAGNGFWRFTNAHKKISFENMEGWFNPPSFIIAGPSESQSDDDDSGSDNPQGPQFMLGTTSSPDDLMASEYLPEAMREHSVDGSTAQCGIEDFTKFSTQEADEAFSSFA